uniref:Uncharacterized protein n=1 Tax=Phenylobacterium glaciei TaxID=2803784 RepID=A0A974P6N2_9CAUL|nr:hypothetical protein JKL49_10070 [Phenylobacterium glaciei]
MPIFPIFWPTVIRAPRTTTASLRMAGPPFTSLVSVSRIALLGHRLAGTLPGCMWA